ncbi:MULTISPECIES: c-type cytochrome [Ramlibacter]|uniref:Cytochrome c4 n=1 Tax=Ramlibacter aquaticus TaxID=2780094 RepID=A0ABR9SHL3_9BURK|nr:MULTISPECIES: c-type cytochrome [Ramlibacter]MBE7941848.1 cytochrome c4 [Ramlibacter aquaticus]
MKPIASLLLAAALAVPALSSLAQTKEGAAPAAAAKAEAAPAAPAKPDLNAGSTKFGAACAGCHGVDGNSGVATYPKLAQQVPEYIIKQLTEFKAGKRQNAIMQGMAAGLSDDDMRNVAYWLASQKAKPGTAKDKDLVMLGEKIYRGGIAEKQVAACAGCHSPNGAGIPAQFPRLSGQHQDYVNAQLMAFREGTRNNSIQMNQIAARLSDKEMKAVADYIAGLR